MAANNQPSQHEANKVLRVIEGKQMKYTIRIHRASGKILEFQSDHPPDVGYDQDTRCDWIRSKVDGESYPTAYPVCRFEPGDVILTEANPKPA